MKANERTIMLCYCLLFPLLCAAASVNAQTPYNSAEWEYTNNVTLNSIIRDDQTYRIIHSQRKDNTLGIYIHTFDIHKYSNGADVEFTTQFNAVDSTDYSVNIMDMEIYEGFCYFCGALDHDCLDMGGLVYSEGFVGRFSISAMFSSTSTVEYYKVPSTRSLHGLAISTPANDTIFTLIHTVGTMDYWYGYAACISELGQTLSTWRATLDYIPGTPKIYFSDIERTRGGFALAAQIKCSNDLPYGNPAYDTNHQQFMVDLFSLNGCHYAHPNPGSGTMYRYIMDYANDFYFHKNMAPMKICRSSWNVFYLAFGVKEIDFTKSGVRVFSFGGAPYTCTGDRYYQLGKTQTVLDMVCPPYEDTPIVLSQGEPYKNGIITITNIINPSTTTFHAYYSNDTSIQSLSRPPEKSFFNASGCEPTNKYLMRFEQYIYAWNQNSCFRKASFGRVNGRVYGGYPFPVVWEYPYVDQRVDWDIVEVKVKDVSETNKCAQ